MAFTGSKGEKPRLAANLGILGFHLGPNNWNCLKKFGNVVVGSIFQTIFLSLAYFYLFSIKVFKEISSGLGKLYFETKLKESVNSLRCESPLPENSRVSYCCYYWATDTTKHWIPRYSSNESKKRPFPVAKVPSRLVALVGESRETSSSLCRRFFSSPAICQTIN